MERFAQDAKAPEAATVCSPEDVIALRDTLKEVYCDEKVGDYILDIVFATREPERVKGLESLKEQIQVGCSPRATLALNKAARARTRSCTGARTRPRRTSRRSCTTSSATASSSPTRPRRRTSLPTW